jgi:CheY-like chemotaxis protein/predicted regulator of Ras-like GTPase activity (Roadblock/LC7/MglB family)
MGAKMAKILVVDHNEAFSMMLQEMLEMDGGYQVEVVHQGRQALDRLRRNDYDLTIVDMDLDQVDMTYQDLIQGIRQIRGTMRLMLIPLMGEDLPAEARHFDIQGTLSKPFFADDLLPNIESALSREVRASPPSPEPARTASPPPAPVRAAPRVVVGPTADVHAVLSELARETRADAVLLVSFTADATDVVAQVSTLSDTQVETLAGLSVDTVRAARAAAHFLGQRDSAFEHNMFESESLRLYIMILSGNHLLVIVTPVNTPLGTIRHNLRRARRDLDRRALT